MTTVHDNLSSSSVLPDFSAEIHNSGFPFDDSEDRGLRSRLDDIAQRHPEFADHLNPEAWGRRRTNSGQSGSAAPSEDPFACFRTRSRFQNLGFPFDDEFENPEYFYPQQEQSQPPVQPLPHPHPRKEEEQSQHDPEAAPSEKVVAKPPSSGAHIQQSNTVDLGQPRVPLVDERCRSQRSMSAPPDHRKRYVSSINIPNVNADMGGSMSQQPTEHAQSTPPSANPKERIIPIHIEGRDEPVVPKSAPTPSGVKSERLFGQRPGIFTQYVPQRQPEAQDDLKQQEELQRQQQQQKYQQQQQQQKQQQQQHQQQQQETPNIKPTSLDLIQNIQKDVSTLMTQVERFKGKSRDKQYLYLDEMLTRKMLLLDDIETGGQDAIRKARKEAIKCIQDTIKMLENIAAANVAELEKPAPAAMEVDLPEKGGQEAEGTPETSDTAEQPPSQCESVTDAPQEDAATSTMEAPAEPGLPLEGVTSPDGMGATKAEAVHETKKVKRKAEK